ncbi:MAG: circadian clock protein KaiC, partial [Gammaproteobacteria bacterium]|nr:circadian clock protein KaiC [Gammaproteobacteria bacterium]
MRTKVTINRLPTGVPGLDEILGGGLPEFSFNLIAGPPGSGKTTLAHQIMFALATPERPALFLTVLGEPPLKMLRYQQQFDFFDREAINRTVRFVSLAEETAQGGLEPVLQRIVSEVEAQRPGLVFVDSFRSLIVGTMGEGVSPNTLQFVQQLGLLMTSWEATTFLVGEYSEEHDANPVFSVADGLIWLRQSVQRNSVVRKLEIMKMRGQATIPGLHTFRISSAGVNVFAAAVGESRGRTDAAALETRLSMGTPRLDGMLGGGLPTGYSVLVSGPSGSGKSILAAAFLAEGGRCGENGVLAVFEQNPRRSRSSAVISLIESGRIGVVENHASDLSIDEILCLLMREIRRLDAKRVVIDSLSGFELAVAPTFRDDFRESLSRMVTTLTSTGVTLLMTCELEDRYGDLR